MLEKLGGLGAAVLCACACACARACACECACAHACTTRTARTRRTRTTTHHVESKKNNDNTPFRRDARGARVGVWGGSLCRCLALHMVRLHNQLCVLCARAVDAHLRVLRRLLRPRAPSHLRAVRGKGEAKAVSKPRTAVKTQSKGAPSHPGPYLGALSPGVRPRRWNRNRTEKRLKKRSRNRREE